VLERKKNDNNHRQTIKDLEDELYL